MSFSSNKNSIGIENTALKAHAAATNLLALFPKTKSTYKKNIITNMKKIYNNQNLEKKCLKKV